MGSSYTTPLGALVTGDLFVIDGDARGHVHLVGHLYGMGAGALPISIDGYPAITIIDTVTGRVSFATPTLLVRKSAP